MSLPKRVTTPKRIPITMESRVTLIKDLFARYVDNTLLLSRWQSMGNRSVASVSWEFGYTSANELKLTITVRHGAFAENEHTSSRIRWSLDYVTEEWIVSALFHELAFDGSPYWWDGQRWQKHGEIAG